MLEANAGAGYDREGTCRYVRWSLFDKQTEGDPGDASSCWLDRRTGRLIYQPNHVDPNASTAFGSRLQ